MPVARKTSSILLVDMTTACAHRISARVAWNSHHDVMYSVIVVPLTYPWDTIRTSSARARQNLTAARGMSQAP